MAEVRLEHIGKTYGAIRVLEDVSLEIAHGEFVVFVGPSGSGKSTLLRMIGGLEEITDGHLYIGGKLVNEDAAADRGLAMVFQNYALFPHMTVFQNLAFPLKMAKASRSEIQLRVQQAAELLQIEHLLERKPRQLSGGQRQRVAIGRAIVREPKVFLFDEPLSNLDAELRVQMRVQIAKLHRALGNTMIYVTHDQIEAMTMADKIVVLRDGKVEQVGTPHELFHHPASRFVAGFIGSPQMNFLRCELVERADRASVVRLPNGQTLSLPVGPVDEEPGQAMSLGIRPEDFRNPGQTPAEVPFRIDLDVVEHLGTTTYLYGATESGEAIVARAPDSGRWMPGQRISLAAAPSDFHLFSMDGRGFRRREIPDAWS